MSTDDHGVRGPLACAHCAAPLEPGRITCPACGTARSLGGPGVDEALVVPPPVPSPPPATGPTAAPDAAVDDGAFDLGDPYRDPVRRRDHRPAERSRTSLLVGGVIGLILVALVAAAALWAMGQHGGAGF